MSVDRGLSGGSAGTASYPRSDLPLVPAAVAHAVRGELPARLQEALGVRGLWELDAARTRLLGSQDLREQAARVKVAVSDRRHMLKDTAAFPIADVEPDVFDLVLSTRTYNAVNRGPDAGSSDSDGR